MTMVAQCRQLGLEKRENEIESVARQRTHTCIWQLAAICTEPNLRSRRPHHHLQDPQHQHPLSTITLSAPATRGPSAAFLNRSTLSNSTHPSHRHTDSRTEENCLEWAELSGAGCCNCLLRAVARKRSTRVIDAESTNRVHEATWVTAGGSQCMRQRMPRPMREAVEVKAVAQDGS